MELAEFAERSKILAAMFVAAAAGQQLIIVTAAYASAMTAGVKEHVTREEYERFLREEFHHWCMIAYDGEPKKEGGDQS